MNWLPFTLIYVYSVNSKIHHPLFINKPISRLSRDNTLVNYPQFIRHTHSIKQRDGPHQLPQELPSYDDATMDYSYMTKDRNPRPITPPGPEEPNTEEQKNVPSEMPTNQVGSQGQAGTFGENSGNMSNNTNSNNTTTTNNHYHNGKPEPAPPRVEPPVTKLKDDVPLGAMQSPTTNLNNTTDASHHKGDTSTFVTNNFYNPPNSNDESALTVGGQLEYEYLWKRIYDIDNKLAQLTPIIKQAAPGERKGLIITFNPEERGKVDVENNLS